MYHKLKKCLNSRSSHCRCSIQSPFNRLAGFKTWKFKKKRLQHRCLPVNIGKFLRTLILMKICEQLLLSFLLLPFIFLLKGLFLLLTQQTFFKGPIQCLKSSPQGAQQQAPVLFEKKKNQPKWSLVVIHWTTLCHSLSFIVTRCTTRCHSLLLVVIRCTTGCHLLSLDVPLVCLFINDRQNGPMLTTVVSPL